VLPAATASAATAATPPHKTCTDPKTHKFIKCPPAPTPPASKHCRDPKTGRFAKCGTPGAVPA
jgi:hypothetical protein